MADDYDWLMLDEKPSAREQLMHTASRILKEEWRWELWGIEAKIEPKRFVTVPMPPVEKGIFIESLFLEPTWCQDTLWTLRSKKVSFERIVWSQFSRPYDVRFMVEPFEEAPDLIAINLSSYETTVRGGFDVQETRFEWLTF